MNQGIFTLLFPSKPKQTSENCSVPIYVDTSFTSKITIEIKQNMLISDIFKFIHEDDDKQNLYLVLIHYSVQRRLWDYEKVEDVLHNNNSKFVIYDFQKKQQIQGQKYPKYFAIYIILIKMIILKPMVFRENQIELFRQSQTLYLVEQYQI